MKRLSLIAFSFVALNSFAQNSVADYKYISIPSKFKDKNMNGFGLSKLLASELKKKNYIAIGDNLAEWPAEIRSNPCSALTAELEDTSNMLRNRIDVNLKDCSGKTILNSRGSSMIKDFEQGFPDALKLSLVKLPASDPKQIVSGTMSQGNDPVGISPVTPEPPVSTISSQYNQQQSENDKSTGVQVYSNGKLNLQKIQIGNGQFILANPNSSVPYATFSPSSRKDVFRVVLENGSMTLGFEENNAYVIELPNNTSGTLFTREVFSKK